MQRDNRRGARERNRTGICLNNECELCKSRTKQTIRLGNDFVCEKCGSELRECAPDKKKTPILPIIIGVVVVIAGIICGLSFMGGEKSVPPVAVDNGFDLGYAVFNGKVKNGKMNDDNGVLTFKSSHIIEPRDVKKRMAAPGEKVIGIFEDGHLVTGKWYKNDGNIETIIP